MQTEADDAGADNGHKFSVRAISTSAEIEK